MKKHNNILHVRPWRLKSKAGFIIQILIPLFLLLLSNSQLHAQRTKSVSIKASATVVQVAEIEMVTIKDLQIDMSRAKKGIITIDPLQNSDGGLMKIKGKAEASFRISFLPQMHLINTRGTDSLMFEYKVFGYPGNEKNASEPIDAVNRQLRFNREGEYYLWIGGRINIRKAKPGSYDGEFTLEIEYI